YKCPIMLNSEGASKKSEKVYYIRKMSNTIRTNAREERELISLARDVPMMIGLTLMQMWQISGLSARRRTC
ncbi:MAG: hypothetical protein IJG94_03490, partial [Clostridia bacterium]|nr:hypothetical protein [Clostridia bacterium]